jgi:tRNA (guanine-N7-)-methyltransferase
VEFRTEDLYHEDKAADALLGEVTSIQTYYESMWLARGLNIRYMRWRLPREGKLEEPDVEIELDDYRSYHRDKRSSKDKAK